MGSKWDDRVTKKANKALGINVLMWEVIFAVITAGCWIAVICLENR